jgi:hypothetical protein
MHMEDETPGEYGLDPDPAVLASFELTPQLHTET